MRQVKQVRDEKRNSKINRNKYSSFLLKGIELGNLYSLLYSCSSNLTLVTLSRKINTYIYQTDRRF